MIKQNNYNNYQGFFSNIRNIYFKKIISPYVGKNLKILDIGCGQGDFLKICQQNKIDSQGIDVSKKWVLASKKRGLRAIVSPVENTPFKDESFDIIFCQSVIEHLKDAPKSIKEIHRILKKGGTIIVSSPTPENDFWDDPTHVRPHTIKSLETLFSMTNFKKIKSNYVFSFLLGINININSLYKILNIIPFPIGSNIIIYGQK